MNQRRDSSVPLPRTPRGATFARVLCTWAGRHVRQYHQAAPTQPKPARRLQRALAAGLAAVALVGGTVGYLLLQRPAPASAAVVILRRAAHAFAASPTQAVHAMYSVAANGAIAEAPAKLDEWVQSDATGAIAKGAITTFDSVSHLQSRTILTGATATTYNAASNTIVQATVDQSPSALPNPLDVCAVGQYVQNAQIGASQDTRLLAPTMLDGRAVNVVEARRAGDVVTLYIDAQASIVRKLDLAQIDANGAAHPVWSLRLTSYVQVPFASMPATTFALNAPSGATMVVTPDGTPQMGSHQIDVAHAVALPNRPAAVLSGDADGLRLNEVAHTGMPTAAIVSYVYARGQNTPGLKVLGVNVVTWPNGALNLSDRRYNMGLPTATTQHLNLTIEGQQVQALYDERPADASHPAVNILVYPQNEAGVRIVASGLSQEEFFNFIAALVDGRTNPVLVTQLQHEVDTSTPLRPQ